MPPALPPLAFGRQQLAITRIEDTTLHRFFRSRFHDPLGYGAAPARFSDPRLDRAAADRFGIVHLASTFETAFAETILRDRGDGRVGELTIPEAELSDWRCATIQVTRTLSLVDLGSGAARLTMGIPSDVVGARDQTLSRAWSLAIHDHSAYVDGILWASRLHGGTCCAVYDRALTKLRASEIRSLTGFPRELAGIIRRYRIALVP